MKECSMTGLFPHFAATILITVLFMGIQTTSAAPEPSTPPAAVGKVAQADWDAYCKWTAALPADQLAWEKMLQKHLGDYYFPVYLKQRLAGGYTLAEPDDWGFVQDDPALPRVLLIGDSISHMYTASVRKLLKGKANVHRAPSNCYSTRDGLANFDDWVAAPPGKRWDLIHFAFGYHDRLRPAQYAANLEKLIARLQKTGAILVWARTVPFTDTPQAGDQVRKLNEIADAVMARHGIKVDDLYATVADSPEKYLCGDKIHYNSEGVKRQSEEVARVIAGALAAARNK